MRCSVIPGALGEQRQRVQAPDGVREPDELPEEADGLAKRGYLGELAQADGHDVGTPDQSRGSTGLGKLFTLRESPPAHSEALPMGADGNWKEETHSET